MVRQKTISAWIAVAFLFIAVACTEGGNREAKAGKTADTRGQLSGASAKEDALAAARRGEIFLYGAQGPSIFLPGVPRERYSEYMANFEVRMIEGTSDAYFGDDFGSEQLKRHLLVVEYAEIFNATIIEQVEKSRSKNKKESPKDKKVPG